MYTYNIGILSPPTTPQPQKKEDGEEKGLRVDNIYIQTRRGSG